MIWVLLCKLGRHDWMPVFVHHVTPQGTTRSLVRCYRQRLNGTLCLAEQYTDSSSGQWQRGSQG